MRLLSKRYPEDDEEEIVRLNETGDALYEDYVSAQIDEQQDNGNPTPLQEARAYSQMSSADLLHAAKAFQEWCEDNAKRISEVKQSDGTQKQIRDAIDVCSKILQEAKQQKSIYDYFGTQQ